MGIHPDASVHGVALWTVTQYMSGPGDRKNARKISSVCTSSKYSVSIQKFPIKSGRGLGGHKAHHAVTRVAPPCLFPPPDTFSIPSVMAELDTDLYGGQSLVLSFYLVWFG
jgi:hypothetical protein